MHTLFRHLDNAAEEDGDTTLTDDSEAMSQPPKRSEAENGEKSL